MERRRDPARAGSGRPGVGFQAAGVLPLTGFVGHSWPFGFRFGFRFDFRFERNLNNTTANYSLNDDGTVKVVNRGYNYVKNKWQEAEGKAKFVGDRTVASLKVSFFGPFYAPYNVIALDENYQYALIVGKNTDYMWILAREKTIPESVKTQYLQIATDLGFDVSKLIWVEHE